MRAVVCGANGAMGQLICAALGEASVGKVSVDGENGACKHFSELPDVKPEVVIDFSHHSAVADVLRYAVAQNCAAVIGTTGHTEEEKQLIHDAARKIPVFFSGNMSLGIAVLCRLAAQAAAAFPEADIEILEIHHNRKVDAPSGTALMIADAINEEAGGAYHYVYDRHDVRQKRDPHEIGLHAVRGGSIVGEHEVLFCGPDEVITLSHSAASRGVFANGAINAAVYLAGRKPGLYTMADLLGDLT